MSATISQKWDKLSPKEFLQLQELASYSTRKLQDVLQEFCSPHASAKLNPDGDIDYDGFRRFLDAFLDCETPIELAQHLFVSFLKTNVNNVQQLQGKTLNQMAAISSTTACAPVTAHTKGSIPNINNIVEINPSSLSSDSTTTTNVRSSFVDKLHHGITDKLHSLSGHLTHDASKTADIKLLTRKLSHFDPLTLKVPLKDVVCYLSLLEAGRPEDKLEFMFRLYDTDGNGVLDTAEMDAIVNQMMAVAEYLGWDVSELRPILQDMMIEIDYDADGTVSLEEWQRGGMTTIPLLVLLGVDSTALKEDGIHVWRLKHFKKPAYCNLCLNMLVGLGKKGLCCVLCKYTVHERCVQHAPASCIMTYVKSKKVKGGGDLLHHWVEGNCYGRCSKCRKRIKAYHGITGLTCRWCHMMLHNRCASSVKKECTLGEFADLIVPPTAICPAVLDRQRSVNQANKATHFQITPPNENNCPLLVFVNPKSGGRQGDRILRKFQYMLNPRQVYDLSKGGPKEGLTLFKDLPYFKVICCGGDGTVGWVLEAMDSIDFATQPAIGVIPLGTGNDLARCLRWGGGYEGENIPKLMDKIKRSNIVMLDRWSIEVTNNPIYEKIPKQKVTLHSNMQKVFELSQSVVVERAFMEKYEEIQRSSSCNTSLCQRDEYLTAQHQQTQFTDDDINDADVRGQKKTSIQERHDGEDDGGEQQSAEAQIKLSTYRNAATTTTSSSCITTKSISMSTFEMKRLHQNMRQDTVISYCSSPTTSCSSTQSTIIRQQQQEHPEQQQQQQRLQRYKQETISTTSLPAKQSNLSNDDTCRDQQNNDIIATTTTTANDIPYDNQFNSNLLNDNDNNNGSNIIIVDTDEQVNAAADNSSSSSNTMTTSKHKSFNFIGNSSQNEMATATTKCWNANKQTSVLEHDSSQEEKENEENSIKHANGNKNDAFVLTENENLVATTPTQNPTTTTAAIAIDDCATSPTPTPTASETKTFNIPIQKTLKSQAEKDCTVPYNIINNYFSVGVDAAICVKFHLEREKNPHKFNSRMKNKLWYFEYATSETFAASCKNLHEHIEIVCDGVSLDLANGPHLQGVALLNIPYTHGGSNLWGEHLSQKRIRKSAGPFRKGKKLKSSDKELSATSFNSVDLSVATQDFGDLLIEVIGLENCLHMGQVRTGLRASGRRLAQCSEVIINTRKTFPMQIDGEPWMQHPCTIKVTHKNQVPMLMAPRSEKGKGFFNMLCS